MAAGLKSIYICTQCGYESKKWLGKCPGCNEWNTLQEETVRETKASPTAARTLSEGQLPVPLDEVAREDFPRVSTHIGELDRVLGGGVVSGSLVLIGGDPGIGKSTLLLQAAHQLSAQGHKVLYVSGEESTRQVALRASRLKVSSPKLYIQAETNLDNILGQITRLAPDFVIVDSIQTMFREDVSSAPGSVTQVRECTALLMQIAKSRGCSIFLVGHVTKAGAIAGPRVLEHMVDTVLYFEGDLDHVYRILRAVKNRFGSTQEIGLFEMKEEGMTEVNNPSEVFLSSDRQEQPGSVVTCSMEGSRPMVVEIQALVAHTAFGNPRRQTAGMDYNRMVLLLAVLEKRAGMALFDQDVYVNVAGGLRLVEPAVDLSCVLAVASSFRGKVLPTKTAAFGEVGLTGEVRAVRFAENRLAELARSGFSRVILPKRNTRGLVIPKELTVIEVTTVAQALTHLEEFE